MHPSWCCRLPGPYCDLCCILIAPRSSAPVHSMLLRGRRNDECCSHRCLHRSLNIEKQNKKKEKQQRPKKQTKNKQLSSLPNWSRPFFLPSLQPLHVAYCHCCIIHHRFHSLTGVDQKQTKTRKTKLKPSFSPSTLNHTLLPTHTKPSSHPASPPPHHAPSCEAFLSPLSCVHSSSLPFIESQLVIRLSSSRPAFHFHSPVSPLGHPSLHQRNATNATQDQRSWNSSTLLVNVNANARTLTLTAIMEESAPTSMCIMHPAC